MSMFSLRKTVLPAAAVLLSVMNPVRAHVDLDAIAGGQILEVGSVRTITWRIVIPHVLENWDLWYSISGPEGPWITIQMDLPPGSAETRSVHSYEWTIPAEAVSDQVNIRVRMDNEGADYEAISIETFAVVPASAFRRGDADGHGALNISDGILILNFLFLGSSEPRCLDAVDADDDGILNISDGIAVFQFLFLGGFEPPAPGPFDCGPDATPEDDLNCAEYSAC